MAETSQNTLSTTADSDANRKSTTENQTHSEVVNATSMLLDSSFSSATNDSSQRTHIPSNWAQKWTEEEDKRLLAGIEQYGENNWKQISILVGTRDPVKCMQRWEKGLRPGIVKGRWSEEEDRNLVYIVSQGHKNWGQVAAHMPGRTSKQCRERWNNYLDPTLIHTPFTDEEDTVILSLHKIHGNKWALISRHLPGRTENTVKLRCHALLRRLPNTSKQQSSDYNKSSSSLDYGGEDDENTGNNHSDDYQDQDGEDGESEHGGMGNFKGSSSGLSVAIQTASIVVSEEVKNLQELLSQDMEERERLMKLQEIIENEHRKHTLNSSIPIPDEENSASKKRQKLDG